MHVPTMEELFDPFKFKKYIEKPIAEFIATCKTDEDFYKGLDVISNMKTEDPFTQKLLDFAMDYASSCWLKSRRKVEVNA